MENERFELFIPGRLCILGEHSDWAGANRVVNGAIPQGMAIVSGIEQGIHAWIEKSGEFEVISDLPGEQLEFHEKMSVQEEKQQQRADIFLIWQVQHPISRSIIMSEA